MPGTHAEGGRVLLVEDDAVLASLVERLLTSQGYEVVVAGSAHACLHVALTSDVDAIVLDRRLPDGDGLEVLDRLRARGVVVPTLVLTAQGSVADRVAGLDRGADDYLVKPFEPDELLARLRAVRRRPTSQTSWLPLGDGALDVEGVCGVRPDGTRVELSRAEAALLELLARRPQRVFSREEVRSVLSPEARSPSLIDTHVYAVRQKLGRSAVRTVRGVGYRAGEIR
jgi:two-component system response regulator QseB